MNFNEKGAVYRRFTLSVPAVIRSGAGPLQGTESRRCAPAMQENPAGRKEDVQFVDRAIFFQNLFYPIQRRERG